MLVKLTKAVETTGGLKPAGHPIEGRDAGRLIRLGVAIPADDEAFAYCRKHGIPLPAEDKPSE